MFRYVYSQTILEPKYLLYILQINQTDETVYDKRCRLIFKPICLKIK